jgi:hypothetical protein
MPAAAEIPMMMAEVMVITMRNIVRNIIFHLNLAG